MQQRNNHEYQQELAGVQGEGLYYSRMITKPSDTNCVVKYTQEKISCSLVLKLKVFISKYLQEHYTRCITRAVLFFKNVPGTFFNATHQVKAIAIAVSEVNPLGKSVDYSTPLHSTRILTLFLTL